MNNCPKCGNPLQAGITSCPICGTDISKELNNKVEQSNIKVASVGQAPVQNQVTPATTEVQVASPVAQAPEAPQKQAVTPSPVKTTEVPVEAPTQQVTGTPQAQTVNQVSQPTPNVQANVVEPKPTEPSTLAPNIPKVELATPIPSIPSSLSDDNKQATPALNVSAPDVKVAPKKKGNKTVLVVVLILLIAVAGGGVYFMFNSSTPKTPVSNNNAQKALANISLSSNGYKLALKDGWISVEDGTNVIITNTSETVAIKLDHSTGNLTEINEDYLKNIMASNKAYTDTDIETTKISAKDTFIVNTKLNSIPLQAFFINGGSNLILSATVVYQSDESKSKFEAEVQDMIGSLSYADESIKAISTIDMYREAFSLAGMIINNRNNSTISNNQPSTEEQEPTENQTTTPNENVETPLETPQDNSQTSTPETPSETPTE